MKRWPILLPVILLCAGLQPAASARADDSTFWEDGDPEVILGVYFDEAGTDSVLEGEVPDTLTAHLMMWNGGNRGEGPIKALEYLIELPEGLTLLGDELPEYSNLAMGTLLEGFVQAILEQPGDGLLINTMTLVRSGELPFDARIRVLPHPDSGYLRYVHRWGPRPVDVGTHLLQPQDGILNPKVREAGWKPIRSRGD